jgi:hypothetical protein
MVWTIATSSGTTTITADGTSSAELETLLNTAISGGQSGISSPATSVYVITNNLVISGNPGASFALHISGINLIMLGGRFVRGTNTRIKILNQNAAGSACGRSGILITRSPSGYDIGAGSFSVSGSGAYLEAIALDFRYIYGADGAVIYGYDIGANATGDLTGCTFTGNRTSSNAIFYLGAHNYLNCTFSGWPACEATSDTILIGLSFTNVGAIKINEADGYFERCVLTEFRTQNFKLGYLTDCNYSALSVANNGRDIHLRNSLEILGGSSEASGLFVLRTSTNSQVYKRTLSGAGLVSGNNPKGATNATSSSSDRLVVTAAIRDYASGTFTADYRGTWESVFVKYGRLPSVFSHAINGLLSGKQSVPFASLTDIYITQSNSATVAAYTGWSITHTTSTIAVTTAKTVQQLHDISALEKASFADSGVTTGGNAVAKCCLPTLGSVIFDRSTGSLNYNLSLSANITGGEVLLASGKNATITAAGDYSTSVISVPSGSTVTVREGATNLQNWTLTGTTINRAAGDSSAAMVTVGNLTGITAGAGVTLALPPVTLTAPNLTSAAFDRVQCRVSLVPGGPINYNNSTGARVSGGNLFVSGDVNLTTNTITISGVNGKITTSSPIRVGGTDLPVPLDPRAVYYPAGAYTSGNAIPLSGTPGGSTIDLIDTGTGDRWLEVWTELASPLITSGSLSVDLTGSASTAGVTLSNGDFIVLQAAHWKGNPQSQVPCTASEYFQQVFQYAGTNLSTLESLVSADLHNQFCVIRAKDGSQVTDFVLDASAPGKIQLDTGVVAFSTYDAALFFYFARSSVAGLRLLRNNVQILGLNEIRVIGELTIEAQVRAVGSGPFTYRADGQFISADESKQIDWLWSGTVGVPVRTEVPVDLSQDVMNTLAAIASAVAVPSAGGSFNPATDPVIVGSIQSNVITASAIANNAITASSIGSDAITAAKFAANSITAAALATDTVTEIQGAIPASVAAIQAKTDQLAFTAANRVDAGVIDKTGFSLTQTFPSNFASLAITGGGAVTAGTVSDKAGYSLSSSQSFNLTGNITGNLSGSVGSVTNAVLLPTLPTDWISAAGVSAAAVAKIQNGLSTYAGGDTTGTTTLLSRLTNTRAGFLDNLDATISSRSTYSGGDTPGTTTLLSRITGAPLLASSYTAPDNASITAIKTKTDQLVFTTANRLDSTAIGVPTNPLLTNDSRLDNLDATIGSRMATFTYTAPPSVSQIWTGFTSGTVATNLITQFQSGLFQATSYTAPNNAGILSAISALPQDKTGYSLSASQTFNLTGNISGSVGSVTGAITLPALPNDWISPASVSSAAVTKIQSGLSTYAGGDTSGTSTLLTLLTPTRAGYLDNLAIYAAPDNAGITSIQNVLAAIQGTGFSTSTDSLKVLSDNLDTKPTAANVRTELATDFSNLEAIIFAS